VGAPEATAVAYPAWTPERESAGSEQT